MNSQFGLLNVWTQGDFVTKAVAVLLIGMSLASWIVILMKTLDLLKYKKIARDDEDFWHSEDFAAGDKSHKLAFFRDDFFKIIVSGANLTRLLLNYCVGCHAGVSLSCALKFVGKRRYFFDGCG